MFRLFGISEDSTRHGIPISRWPSFSVTLSSTRDSALRSSIDMTVSSVCCRSGKSALNSLWMSVEGCSVWIKWTCGDDTGWLLPDGPCTVHPSLVSWAKASFGLPRSSLSTQNALESQPPISSSTGCELLIDAARQSSWILRIGSCRCCRVVSLRWAAASVLIGRFFTERTSLSAMFSVVEMPRTLRSSMREF